ncbi:hypothetical protein JCM11641_000525 [Rhodosporidiobolus odoratus]
MSRPAPPLPVAVLVADLKATCSSDYTKRVKQFNRNAASHFVWTAGPALNALYTALDELWVYVKHLVPDETVWREFALIHRESAGSRRNQAPRSYQTLLINSLTQLRLSIYTGSTTTSNEVDTHTMLIKALGEEAISKIRELRAESTPAQLDCKIKEVKDQEMAPQEERRETVASLAHPRAPSAFRPSRGAGMDFSHGTSPRLGIRTQQRYGISARDLETRWS